MRSVLVVLGSIAMQAIADNHETITAWVSQDCRDACPGAASMQDAFVQDGADELEILCAADDDDINCWETNSACEVDSAAEEVYSAKKACHCGPCRSRAQAMQSRMSSAMTPSNRRMQDSDAEGGAEAAAAMQQALMQILCPLYSDIMPALECMESEPSCAAYMETQTMSADDFRAACPEQTAALDDSGASKAAAVAATVLFFLTATV